MKRKRSSLNEAKVESTMESKVDDKFAALAARLEAQSFSSFSSLTPLDLKLLGNSHMTWKERKALENQRVESLGGKPVKKQRLPLSAAKVRMKNQKKRDEKALQEGMVLGRFAGKRASSSNRGGERRKAEDRVLRSSEGYFKNGVLDVKHLLRPSSTKSKDNFTTRLPSFGGGGGPGKGKKKQGGGGKKGGKKRGGKRH